MNEPADTDRVDPEHPWLGLKAYTPATQAYFYGRDAQIAELYDRVRLQPLTVLYGRSGLGKTSLLGAGLLPRLKVEGRSAALIRLRFDDGQPSLVQQVRKIVLQLAGLEETHLAASLWELAFGDRYRAQVELTRPVLMFDQFEEVYTLARPSGERTLDRRAEVAELMSELASLVERRPPQALVDPAQSGNCGAHAVEHSESALRVLLTLRQDFLHELERWKKLLPGLMRNRMELKELDGLSACLAVTGPGRKRTPPLVDEAVAEAIVRFVADAEPELELSEIDAVPPLLSLLCAELNEARIKSGQDRIGADQVPQGSKILEDYFQRCFDGMPGGVREAIEDSLINPHGFRESPSRDMLLAQMVKLNVTSGGRHLDQLIDLRLLSAELHGGVQRIEFTHDLLVPMALRSREQRQQREAAATEQLRIREQIEAERERAKAAERQAAVEQKLAAGERERARLAAAAAQFEWDHIRGRAEAAEAQARAAETEARSEQHRRRSTRRFAIAMLLLAMLAAATSWYAWDREHTAATVLSEAATRALGRAQDRFNLGETPAALAYLGESLRYAQSPLAVAQASMALQQQTPLLLLKLDDQHTATAQFSPDGSFILTGGFDGTLQKWDSQSGRRLGASMGQPSVPVLTTQISADGNQVIAQAPGRVSLWNSDTGQRVWPREGQSWPGGVGYARFIAGDVPVAVLATRNTVQILDLRSDQPLGKLLQVPLPISSACLSPDGTGLLTLDSNGATTLWDTRSALPTVLSPGTGKQAVFLGQKTACEFSPDGDWLGVASAESTQIRNGHSGAAVGTAMPQLAAVQQLLFRPDSAWLMLVEPNAIQFIESAGGVPVSGPRRPDTGITTARFSADGVRTVVGGADGKARVLPDGPVFEHTDEVNTAAFSPDGTRVVTTSAHGGTRIWDARSRGPLGQLLASQSKANAVGFAPDGATVATADARGFVQLWNTKSGQQLGVLALAGAVYSVQFSRDGHQLVTAGQDGTGRVIGVESGKLVSPAFILRHEDAVYSAQFSPDGALVATASADKTGRLWDSRSGQPAGAVLQHDGIVQSIQFSPDGSRVATASQDGSARLWDARSGKALGLPMQHGDLVYSAVFSPDGLRIATTCEDGLVRLWDGHSAVPIGTPLGNGSGAQSAHFSPDGNWLVVTGLSGVQLWNVATARPWSVTLGESNTVHFARFSADGRRIVTASDDATATVWDSTTRERLGWPLTHLGAVHVAQFSPDGNNVATISEDGAARLWSTRELGFEVRLAPVLDALGGLRTNQDGRLEPVDKPLDAQLEQFSGLPADSRSMLAWQLERADQRTISPFSSVTRSAYVDHEIDRILKDGGRSEAVKPAFALQRAYGVDPAHPLILLAMAVFEERPATKALWKRLGLQRLGADAPTAARAAQILQRDQDRPNATIAARIALTIDPANTAARKVLDWAEFAALFKMLDSTVANERYQARDLLGAEFAVDPDGLQRLFASRLRVESETGAFTTNLGILVVLAQSKGGWKRDGDLFRKVQALRGGASAIDPTFAKQLNFALGNAK